MVAKKTKSVRSVKTGRLTKPVKTKDSANGCFLTQRNAKSGRLKSSTTVVAGRDPMPPKDRGRVVKASIDSAGRILVPVKLRKALALEPGDDVNLELKGDVLEIRSLDDAIDDAQAVLKKYVPKKRSLVDELIAERRAEAAKE